MRLSKDLVKHVVKLANLPLTFDEEKKYSKQLSKILDYIEKLNSADTSKVEPTYNVSGLENVMAKDEISESLSQEDATKNATQKKDGFIVTKGIFQDE